jgi:hypothetical protein
MKFTVLAATLAAVQSQQINGLVPDFGDTEKFAKHHKGW